jgi:F-type H+-transporting ATPase subunit b
MVYEFLNFDLLETNVLNLSIVLGVVLTVFVDAFSALLDGRRQKILAIFREADLAADQAKERLRRVKEAVREARIRSEELLTRTNDVISREDARAQQDLDRRVRRAQDGRQQEIFLGRQQIIIRMSQKIVSLSLAAAEESLVRSLGLSSQRQRKLSEVYVRRTIYRLDGCSGFFFYFMRV